MNLHFFNELGYLMTLFLQFADYLIVAINGDGSETEDFLTRKTLVFVKLTGFLMGPVHEEYALLPISHSNCVVRGVFVKFVDK